LLHNPNHPQSNDETDPIWSGLALDLHQNPQRSPQALVFALKELSFKLAHNSRHLRVRGGYTQNSRVEFVLVLRKLHSVGRSLQIVHGLPASCGDTICAGG
jgi:hypothetical protein